MVRQHPITAASGLAIAFLVAACVGGGGNGGAQGTAADTIPRGQQGQAGANAGSGMTGGRAGGMMGGVRGMMGGMMGNAPRDTAAAPTAKVATASATGCPATSQALVDQGRTIFTGRGNCYACHASTARGTSAAPDLTDSTWLDTDGSYGAIAHLVRVGVAHPKKFPGVMPANGGAALDSLEVCAVAAYVYSLGH